MSEDQGHHADQERGIPSGPPPTDLPSGLESPQRAVLGLDAGPAASPVGTSSIGAASPVRTSFLPDALSRYLWLWPVACVVLVAVVGQWFGPAGALLSDIVLLTALLLAAARDSARLILGVAATAVIAITVIVFASLKHLPYLAAGPPAHTASSTTKQMPPARGWTRTDVITFTLRPGSAVATVVPAGCDTAKLHGVLTTTLDPPDRDGPFTVYVFQPAGCAGQLSVGEGEAQVLP